MRISAELLERAEQRVNPNLERELVIRGLGIPSIENMAAARDDFDAWDLSNNRIMRLENLPRVKRLKSLYCAGNIIESIDARNLSENASNITSLSLSHNNISSLLEMVSLGKACPKLEFLSLDGNPVTNKQYFRLYTIQSIPSLKVLDFVKIKPAERQRAERLVQSAAGATLETDLQEEAAARRSNTFVPGEGLEEDHRSFTATTTFTAEQKGLIRTMLLEASSAKEVEDIENAVRRGVLPKMLKKAASAEGAEFTESNSNGDTVLAGTKRTRES